MASRPQKVDAAKSGRWAEIFLHGPVSSGFVLRKTVATQLKTQPRGLLQIVAQDIEAR